MRSKMKGKKSDPEFVSSFISKCVQQGITIPEDILQAAKFDIQNIDDKIKEVETLKILRSKLLDVVFTFDKLENKVEEAKLLPLFNLQHPGLCKYICDMIREEPVSMAVINSGELDDDAKFCFKQLLEHKIVSRVENHIIQGERFDEYMKFVLHEEE